MKIAVVGPGALGCLFAALLAIRSDHLIWILDHDPGRAALLSDRGLLLATKTGLRQASIRASANAMEIGPVDLALLCVKSRDVPVCLRQSASLFSDHSLLLAFQNGISHLNVLENESGGINWAIAVTFMGATLIEPGHVRHGGEGITLAGVPLSNDDSLVHGARGTVSEPQNDLRVKLLHGAVGALSMAGIETRPVDNILDHVWAKLIVNVGINALTAVHNCPNGALLDSPFITERMAEAVREAAAVSHAKGIHVREDPVEMTVKVCRATAHNISSMLQDVRKKRPTEIDAINGAVVKEASLLGIPAPVNIELVREVRRIEQVYM